MQNSSLRTMNVQKEMPGVTDNLLVNIAYNHRPGLTYTEAKEFEYELQMRLQALLADMAQRRNPATPPADSDIRFIPMPEALEVTQHPNRKAFYHWRTRYNSRHKGDPIILRSGLVDYNSLIRALTAQTADEVAA